MLLFVTAHGHSYTVMSLLQGTFGAATPACQVTTYDALFQATRTRQATHIFADRNWPWPQMSTERFARPACLA